MDCTKECYLSEKKYVGKVTPQCWGNYDLSLFTKYYEPEINTGGSFTDGVTSFSLEDSNRGIYSNSPFSQVFDTVSGGYSYTEAGKRAILFVNTITDRIETALDTLRSLDSSTNEEFTSIKVI